MHWIARGLRRMLQRSPRAPDLTEFERFGSFEDYRLHRIADPVVRQKMADHERIQVADRDRFEMEAYCYVCSDRLPMRVDMEHGHAPSRMPNWRERVLCPRCGLNNRMRAAVHFFEHQCQPAPAARIYVTEQITPLYAALARRHTHVTGSEYLGGACPAGARDSSGVRNESLTGLTFGAESFDYILSFDVLEHIPDYSAALGECLRCLRPGGQLLLSAPFVLEAEETIIRARVLEDGGIEHLLPPEYHGDPMSSDGCLCFYHFGWALLDDMREIGFDQVELWMYWSPAHGYLGGPQAFFHGVKRS